MEASNLLDQFEATSADQRASLLRSNPRLKGISKRFFERVVFLMGADPSAAKQLAGSWKAVADFGDNAAFAYRAKAVLERLNGEWARSARSFVKAASVAADSVDQISFQTGAIDSLARAGKTDRAVLLGRRIARQLESKNERALAGRAWLNTGNACLWADKHRIASDCFTSAIRDLEGTEYKVELAAAHLGISSAALYVESPGRAMALAEWARDQMSELGAIAHANHAEVNLGTANLLQGRADEAIRIFRRLRDAAEPESLEFARLSQFLGDALVELDMFDAGLDAYESALKLPAIRLSPINEGNCYLGVGTVKLHQGKPDEASRAFRSAQTRYTTFRNEALSLVAQLGLARSLVARGNRHRAQQELLQLAAQFRSKRMNYYLAVCLIEIDAVREDESALSEASRIIRRNGYQSLEWSIHSQRAARSEGQVAKRHYRRMLASILEHRAQLSSITARLNLLAPCQESIRRYLELLLDEGSKRSIDEAMRALLELRSITILDETALSGAERLTDQQRDTLNQIRSQIDRADRDQIPGGPLRRNLSGAVVRSADLRDYIELIGMQRIGALTEAPHAESTLPLNVFALLPNGASWISNGRPIRLTVGREEIRRRLDWIHFELFAPLNGFECDESRLEAKLSDLRQLLRIDELATSDGQLHLAVEDIGYFVPWNLLTDKRPVLHLRPVAVVDPQKVLINSRPRVAIWYHGHPSLPHIDQEVESIKELFDDVMVCQTVDEVLRSARSGKFDLVHVAAHGRFDSENPMFSSLQLKDGHLLASDIARSGLSTRVATIASCDSAQLSSAKNWEPQGLVRAFLATGAEVVIGSIWPLDDASSIELARTFYSAILRGFSVAVAIAEAQRETKLKYRHPAFWGPLTMFGGYVR